MADTETDDYPQAAPRYEPPTLRLLMEVLRLLAANGKGDSDSHDLDRGLTGNGRS